MNNYIVLIETDDRKGLVYDITRLFLKYNLNILRNNEFVDSDKNRFFMRSEVVGNINHYKLKQDLVTVLPKKTDIKIIDKNENKKDIVIFASQELHCLGDLLLKHTSGELPINIVGVISNYNSLESFVKMFNIPFYFVSHSNINRNEHEDIICDILEKLNFDLIVLAKYMRIFSHSFVQKYNNIILNIHHSFLPAFIGANPYHDAYQRGVKMVGATSHIVTSDLDEGPIIDQDVRHIDHTISINKMILLGKDIEKVVLARALNLLIEDKVFIFNNKTIIL